MKILRNSCPLKRWIETTNAIGLISKAGRYGGTLAHKYIAFENDITFLSTVLALLTTEYVEQKSNEK